MPVTLDYPLRDLDLPPKTGPGSMLVIWPERGIQMASRRRTPEQINAKLREAEVGLAQGQTVAQVCKANRCHRADLLSLA